MAATVWLIFVQFILIFCQKTTNASDPCTDTLELLPHLNERLVGHIPKANDTLICDYYLPEEKWYSLTETYVLANSPKRCGTTFNWYQKDPLPKHDVENVTICRNAGRSRTCSETKTIQVKKCAKGYVFRLPPLDGCAEAFCIQNKNGGITAAADAPDISSITPTINVEVINHLAAYKSTLEFYCDITPPTRTNYYYVVEWSLHTGRSYATSLFITLPIQHQDVKDFRKSTSLTESHLINHGIHTIGFTLGCSVKAQKDPVGDFSSTRASPPKYFGIEVHNTTKLTLKDGEEKTVYLKLTVPFGCGSTGSCSLDVHTFIPNKKDTCAISHLSHSGRKGNLCGVKFFKDDFLDGKLKAFTIKAKFGKTQLLSTNLLYDVELTTPSKYSGHPFFQDYQAASIRVELQVDQTNLRNKRCYSHSDPHMQTFDGETYDNQRGGTFIMYRHTELEIEVQTKTRRCTKWDNPSAHWRPWCNCAVAVRAGQDIFIIDHCDKHELRPARVVICEDGVFQRNIRRQDNTYKIFLPSGGTVELDDDTEFINVDILPSLTDFKKTEGLCGLFDNNRANDKDPRPGYAGLDISVSWMVKAEENLFNTSNYVKLKHWKEEKYLCDCKPPRTSHVDALHSLTSAAECDTTTKILCEDDRNMKRPRNSTCDYKISQRKKRDVQSSIEEPEFDDYTDVSTAYFVTKDFYQAEITQREEHSRERRSVYDNITARQDCLKLMNTSAFRMCDNIPNLNFDGLIENCISDAVVTNSMEWTNMHLEKIKSSCIHHVDVLQPIPPDILAELVLPENNATNSTNTTEDANTTLAFQSLSTTQALSPELFAEIKSVSCPNECSGHGRCANGECTCDPPFKSFDCSINSTKPPIIAGIPDKGKCDLRVRKCAETAIFGRNFAETSSLRCRLVPFIMDKNKNVTHSEIIETTGNFESLLEVYCPLQTSRSKRSTHQEVRGDFISRGYRVSVSNNGVDFSDEDTIVIFDSDCVSCSKAPGKILCTTKTGYCMQDGRCYKPGDMAGCYACREDNPGHVTWEAGQDCPKPIIPEENGKLWIIGAVLGPVAALIIVVTAGLCYIGKRSKASK